MGWRSGAAGAVISNYFILGLHGRYLDITAPAAPLRQLTDHTDYSTQQVSLEMHVGLIRC